MSRLFYHTMQDNAGNLLFGVSGTMRLAGSGTLATIYGDEALTVILPNPMTNHPSFGSFKCFLGAGDYDFYMAKAGYTFETLTGVQGHGTMAQQDASNVLITGGTAVLTKAGIGTPLGANPLTVAGIVDAEAFAAANRTGNDQYGFFSHVTEAGGANRYAFAGNGTAPSYFNGRVGLGTTSPAANARMTVDYLHDSKVGIGFRPADNDTGSFGALQFYNMGVTGVGSITTTAAATFFNTSSDGRLKHDVQTLTGELDLLKALRPVSFLWNVDDSPGVGFLAADVAAHVPGVVSGEPDAMEEDGRIRPQQIDHSKLVPWLVGAVKTLAAQVESLTARLEACGG